MIVLDINVSTVSHTSGVWDTVETLISNTIASLYSITMICNVSRVSLGQMSLLGDNSMDL
jgi:hypothetical protein